MAIGKKQLLAPNGHPSNLNAIQYALVRTTAFKQFFGDWENDPENSSKVVDENGEPLPVWHGGADTIHEFDERYSGNTTANNEHGAFFFTNEKQVAEDYSKQAIIRRYEGRDEDKLRDYYKELSEKDIKDILENIDDYAESKIKVVCAFLNIRAPYIDDSYHGGLLDTQKLQRQIGYVKRGIDENYEFMDNDYVYDQDVIDSYKKEIEERARENNSLDEEDEIDEWQLSEAQQQILEDNGVEMELKKYDGLIIKDCVDDIGEGSKIAQDEYIALNPNQIKDATGMNTSFSDSNELFYAKGGALDEDKKEIYKKWKHLINMSASELSKFYFSKDGKEAGLSPSEAKSHGIHNGRQSARWIMKMKKTPIAEWTPEMWKWANRQISFVSRMRGNAGALYDGEGNRTRKLTSLLIWGHNPEKFEGGGAIDSGMIVCENCGWSWKVEDAGEDKYICHKCGHDNSHKYNLAKESSVDKFEGGDFLNNQYLQTKIKANEIITGSKSLKRLSQAEERGRIAGGKRNVEATIICQRISGTGSEAEQSILQQQELEKYSKAENIWFDYSEKPFEESLGEFYDRGSEAKLYSKFDGFLIKAVELYYSASPLDFLDRISLHNYLFPQTNCEIIGFGKNEDDLFVVIFKQPQIISDKKATIEEIRVALADRGFIHSRRNDYYNSDYILDDMSSDNVLIDNFGNYQFIDTRLSLNTKDLGLGGTREIEEEKFAKGGGLKGDGDCMKDAYQVLTGSINVGMNFIGTPYVVHAEVAGHGKLKGKRFAHAWVEDDALVYDLSNGNKGILPKALYYKVGDIGIDNPKKYIRYSLGELMDKVGENGTYGDFGLLDCKYEEGGAVIGGEFDFRNHNQFKDAYAVLNPIFKIESVRHDSDRRWLIFNFDDNSLVTTKFNKCLSYFKESGIDWIDYPNCKIYAKEKYFVLQLKA